MTMSEYVVRVRVGPSYTEVTVRAASSALAIQIVEAQYGRGSYFGILSETRL